MPDGRILQELDANLGRSRLSHETPLNSDPRCARGMKGQGHRHARTEGEFALDMTAMRIKPPDRALSESVFVVYYDGAGNGKVFRIARGEAGLHGATLGSRRSNGHSALDGNCCTSESFTAAETMICRKGFGSIAGRRTAGIARPWLIQAIRHFPVFRLPTTLAMVAVDGKAPAS